jgi:hypothetical protein
MGEGKLGNLRIWEFEDLKVYLIPNQLPNSQIPKFTNFPIFSCNLIKKHVVIDTNNLIKTTPLRRIKI